MNSTTATIFSSSSSSPRKDTHTKSSPWSPEKKNKKKKKKSPRRSYPNVTTTSEPTTPPSTPAAPIVFVDDKGSTWDLQLDVCPENDQLLQAQSIPESERLGRLQAWLTRNGARFNGFEFRLIAPEYRGLFSTRDLASGFEFIFVPSFLLLNSKQWSHNAIGYIIRNKKPDFSDGDYDDIFIWWLLIERFNPESYWKFWIPTLPLRYQSHPYFWDEKSLDWLKGTQALDNVLNGKKEIENKYNEYTNLIPMLKLFSFEQFLWATVAVWSRVWGDSLGDTGCPLMDMINHSPQAIWHRWNDDGMAFVTDQPVPNGTQMFLDYGRRSQLDWFTHYGFTNPNNEIDNSVQLHVRLEENDPHYAEKGAALGYNSFVCELSLNYDMVASDSRWCYSFARARFYKGVDFTTLNENMEPVNFANELSALRYLGEEANQSLSKFPNTYEEDLKILGGTPNLISTDFNFYNALVVRTSEKQILHHIMELSSLLDSLNLEVEPLLSDYDKSNSASVSKLDSTLRAWTRTHTQKNEYIKKYFESVLLSLFPELAVKPEVVVA